MDAIYSVTLARAHKLADRLGAKLGQVQSTIGSFSATTVFSQAPSGEQIQALKSALQDVKSALMDHAAYSEALSKLRAAIGRANSLEGVGDVLASIEDEKRSLAAHNRLMAAYRRVSASMLQLPAPEGYVWPLRTENYGASVECTVVRPEEIQRLQENINDAENRLFKLQDQLADLNAKKVQLSFPDDIAKFLGLV